MSTPTGVEAELKVSQKLAAQGYKIIAKNWRTRLCEIDIVANRQGAVYFVEVKYRANENQGDGIEYITPKKLKQMHFAAELWCANHQWTGDYQLAAVAVSGPDFDVGELLIID